MRSLYRSSAGQPVRLSPLVVPAGIGIGLRSAFHFFLPSLSLSSLIFSPVVVTRLRGATAPDSTRRTARTTEGQSREGGSGRTTTDCLPSHHGHGRRMPQIHGNTAMVARVAAIHTFVQSPCDWWRHIGLSSFIFWIRRYIFVTYICLHFKQKILWHP